MRVMLRTAAEISATRDNPRLPGIPLDRSIVVTHDIAAAGRADIIVIAVPAQNSRTAVAALAPHLAAGTPVDRQRQGHRAWHAAIHDRGGRRSRASSRARDPVRTEFCRRRGARVADRGDAGGERRNDGGRAGPRARLGRLPSLSHHGRARRRDRRRGEKRACDRGRHRRRDATRRVGAGGADDARRSAS